MHWSDLHALGFSGVADPACVDGRAAQKFKQTIDVVAQQQPILLIGPAPAMCIQLQPGHNVYRQFCVAYCYSQGVGFASWPNGARHPCTACLGIVGGSAASCAAMYALS